ncbi:O-antigen ligase family protein [Dielma fastidiosa]|uniref:O-antigen ligase-like membrane protein n=1 Tax=Dielma fastidiosa TaxID=1034346 RepID=A0A318KKJ4_9FIRM|nr:O-antigen ligase family protein [Dielma fastidiosa]PXX77148.1 O-antigen ligase-like membrane protein [Dielma fastidiosa]
MINLIIKEAKSYTMHQLMLLTCLLSMFMPFYIGLMMLAALTLGLMMNGELKVLLQETPQAKAGLLVILAGFIGALVYGNLLGIGCSFMMLVILIAACDLRRHCDAHFYDRFIKLILLMSVVCFAHALLEYLNITESLNYQFTDLIIPDLPKYRVNSVFFNANYYAMMCEFFIIIALAKLITSENKGIYFFIILCNLSGLYLTGCRSAWPALAVAILILFYFAGKRKTAALLLLIEICLGLFVLMEPELLPRLESSDSSMDVRIGIWQTAVQQFKVNPLLGHGPLTYMQVYPQFNGIATQHAHNIFLDALINFGILGVVPLIIFIVNRLKEAFKLCDIRKALVLALTVIVMIHGLLDATIFWSQTSFLYLSLLMMTVNLKTDEA